MTVNSIYSFSGKREEKKSISREASRVEIWLNASDDGVRGDIRSVEKHDVMIHLGNAMKCKDFSSV